MITININKDSEIKYKFLLINKLNISYQVKQNHIHATQGWDTIRYYFLLTNRICNQDYFKGQCTVHTQK